MFSHFRVQRRFAEMEVLKTLSQDRVHQRLGEQIIRRSEALLEASRRFWAQVEEEEAEEEEIEERDFKEEPLHFRALVRRAPPGCSGTMVMVVPVIMQPEFQQSFLFFPLKVPQIQFMIRVLDIPVV